MEVKGTKCRKRECVPTVWRTYKPVDWGFCYPWYALFEKWLGVWKLFIGEERKMKENKQEKWIRKVLRVVKWKHQVDQECGSTISYNLSLYYPYLYNNRVFNNTYSITKHALFVFTYEPTDICDYNQWKKKCIEYVCTSKT